MSSRYIILNKNHMKKSINFFMKSLGVNENKNILKCDDQIKNIKDVAHECVESGMSSAIVNDNGDILAQILNANLYEIQQIMNTKMDLNSSIDAFITKASNLCVQKNPMDVLYIYDISSDHFFNKQKYVKYLVEKTIEDARLHKFERIVVNCTDHEYRHVLHRAGFQDKLRCNELCDRGIRNNNIITDIIHMEKIVIDILC